MTGNSDWKIKVVPLAYRVFALALAVIYLEGVGNYHRLALDSHILITLAVIELLLSSLPPFLAERLRESLFSLIICALSVIISFGVVFFSGAIESPFILYALAPVVSCALFLSSKITILTSAVTTTAVIVSTIFNPFFTLQLTHSSISQISLFVVVNIMIVTLPYVVNLNLKQRLAQKNILAERQRISREIHDGVAQTLHALCWQVQQVNHLTNRNELKSKDLEQLENLAEQAREDILQAMDTLRNHLDQNDFRTILTGCLEDFAQANDIEYVLNYEVSDFSPDLKTKSELVSICREALANVKKHAGASSIQVNLRQVHGNIELSLVDNGCGFDSVAFYHHRFESPSHHGLQMMQERAQLINGRLHILSLPRHGTEIKLEIPSGYARSRSS